MEQSHAVDVLSDLIAAIYDCAVDPSLWPNALSAMCREMAFRSAALNLRSFPSGTCCFS
jgi:hypothetical protein